jgi:hypothetical protein
MSSKSSLSYQILNLMRSLLFSSVASYRFINSTTRARLMSPCSSDLVRNTRPWSSEGGGAITVIGSPLESNLGFPLSLSVTLN